MTQTTNTPTGRRRVWMILIAAGVIVLLTAIALGGLARINLHSAQANLEDATLRAPFAGVITAVHVAEGAFANGPAVDLTDLDSLQVVLDVDEVDLRDLAIGPAAVTLRSACRMSRPWPTR